MAYTIYTHDGWGRTGVGSFATLSEAREAFNALCQDPWYRQDGGIRGLELVAEGPAGQSERLDWFAFR